MIPATGTSSAPKQPVDSYWCDCHMVLYERQKEGHMAASHIVINGERKRMTYQLHCWHNQWHRKIAEAERRRKFN